MQAIRIPLAVALVLAAAPAGARPVDAQAAVATRVEVLYDPAGGGVMRTEVRVIDPHPELKLEFTWTPDRDNRPGVDAAGYASGRGRLDWTIPGTASYDPRAVHDSYSGGMKAGAFDGDGRLTYRDGSQFTGTWRAGRLQGQGTMMDAQGNRYDGAFVAGLPEGQGIWRDRAGWTWRGGFAGGLRQGPGTVELPGGQSYQAVMDHGREISSTRPATVTDPTLSGLLPAEAGGGDAGKVELSLVTDSRVALETSLPYTHFVDQGAIEIYPQDQTLTDIWNGSGEMVLPGEFVEYSEDDWSQTRAYLDIDLATSGGSKVKLQSLSLAVDYTKPHLRPMLSPLRHSGCIGLRADFNFENYGWGQVQNARARVRFANPDSYDYDHPDAPRPTTGDFDLPVGNFDDGADVDLRGVLQAAGVDLARLYGQRFACQSVEQMDFCAQTVMGEVNFGQLTGFVASQGDGVLSTEMLGEMSYDWTDADGQVQNATESFHVPVQLTVIETPNGMAEMGAGGAFAIEAPQFFDVELPVAGQNFRVNLPLRGNPNIAHLSQGVKLWARASTLASFHVEAQFADGSVRSSAPAYLFFLHPRQPQFTSGATPQTCYLNPDLFAPD